MPGPIESYYSKKTKSEHGGFGLWYALPSSALTLRCSKLVRNFGPDHCFDTEGRSVRDVSVEDKGTITTPQQGPLNVFRRTGLGLTDTSKILELHLDCQISKC